MRAMAISQGFIVQDNSLTTGMAASYSDSDKSIVEPATISNANQFVGIVTTQSNSQVTLKNSTSNVIIATSGEATAFTSNLNGDVKTGDLLVVSPIHGVLVKASASDSFAVGTALQDFSSAVANTTTVKSTEGNDVKTEVAPLRIVIAPQNIVQVEKNNSSFLQVIGEGIVGRTINNWQVATVLAIFVMLIIVEGSLVYGAIHGSIISLGRNPLAKEAVYKQLSQALIVVGVVFAFGSAIIYLVLQI